MFEGIANFFKKLVKSEAKEAPSKDTAKERLHLVLMQDRANVSADFLELMKQEIIEVIKKYIEVEETAIDVRLTNDVSEDGTQGAPSLYANIPIINIKHEVKTENKEEKTSKEEEPKENVEDEKNKEEEPKKEEIKEEKQELVKEEENLKDENKEVNEKKDKQEKTENTKKEGNNNSKNSKENK